ncbi:MAG: sensor histidine kinase, partial [Algicola sp.]|nr:sensor histidine kinase [Algicola sp.]
PTVQPIVRQQGYLIDQSGQLTAAQVALMPATKFTSMGLTTEFGPTEYALWVRLTIENPLNTNLSKILDTANFVVARAALYSVNRDGSVTLLYDKSGHNTSVLLQNDRRFAVPIELAPKAVTTLLIGYQSDFYTHLHLQFKSQDEYLGDYRLQMAASIAIVAILALLCFINLLFFFALRERFHLLYSLQQLLTIALVLSEVGLLGGDFHFAGGQTRAGGLLPLVVMGLALMFTADFLNLKSTMPKVNRLFMGLAGFFFAALPFGFWGVGYYPFFTHVIPVLISFSILIPVIFAVRLFYRGLTYVVPFIGGGLMLGLCVFPYLAAQVDVVVLEKFPHYWFLLLGILSEGMLLFAAITMKISMARQKQQHYYQTLQEVYRRQVDEAYELQAQAQTAVAALDEKQQKDQHLAATSHDIHHHLYLMRLSLAGLSAGPSGNSTTNQSVDTLKQSMEYLQGLTEHILESSKQAHLSAKKEIPLDEFFASLHQTLGPVAQQKGISLKYRCHQQMLSGSHVLLKRIMENLINNALEYTRKGGVLFALRQTSEHWVLCVYDTGSGISQAHLAQLFEVFKRGDSMVNEGYGLGLYIASTLCHQADYQLVVKSRKGRGTVFFVKISKSAV